jgi:hypothetical protein
LLDNLQAIEQNPPHKTPRNPVLTRGYPLARGATGRTNLDDKDNLNTGKAAYGGHNNMIDPDLTAATAQKQNLETEVRQLETAKSNLEAKNKGLEQTSRVYQEKLAGEQFKTTLSLVEKDSTNWVFKPTLPVLIPELIKIVRQDISHRSQDVSILAQSLDSEKRPRVRASLLIVLYKATGDTAWREKIKDEFLETLKVQSQPNIILALSPELPEARLLLVTGVSNWSERERVRLSLELLDSISLSLHPSPDLISDTFHLACPEMWKEDLNVGRVNADNVHLLLVCLGNARNISLDRNRHWGQRVEGLAYLRNLSDEAFTATVATILSDPNTDSDTRRRMDDSVIGLLPETLSDDVEIPRTASDAPVWKTWVEENADLVKLYMDPKLNQLRIKLKKDHHIPF